MPLVERVRNAEDAREAIYGQPGGARKRCILGMVRLRPALAVVAGDVRDDLQILAGERRVAPGDRLEPPLEPADGAQG